jgi:AsmA family protein
MASTHTRPPLTRAAIIAKYIALGMVALSVLVAVGVAVMPDSVWKHLIVRVASRETGREASIDGDVRVHILRLEPEFTVEGFRLANADWVTDRPMLAVRRVDARLSLLALLRLRLEFPRVQIEGPDVDLERDAGNRANWDFSSPGAREPVKPDNSPPAHLPVVRQLSVSDGTLKASDAIRKLKFNGRFSVSEQRSTAGDGAFALRGSGLLNGKPFDLRVDGGPLLNIDASKPYGFDAAISAADIKLNAHTDIEHPFDLAAVTSKFHLTGKDLADAYYLTGLALPNTPPYDVAGTAVRDNLTFRVDDFRGRLGSSDIGGKLALDTGLPRPKLTAALSSKLLNLADLAAPLGTQASAEIKSDTLSHSKGGSSGLNPKSKEGKRARPTVAAADPQSNDTGFLLPDADLQVNRVRAMDSDVRFEAASITTAKLPMKKVRFHLLLDDARLTLNPLEFTLPEGRFSGNVAINARGAVPETDIDMKLEGVNLAQFKPKGSETAPLDGHMVGRVRLHGTGSSVHKMAATSNGDLTLVVPKGDMRSAFAELTGIDLAKGLGLLLTKKEDKTEVRCGVASFHADHGDLKANTLVVDTTHVLVTGGGNVNLRDEALNLSLRGQPKEVRLVRLRSPIKVSGTLAHPDIGLQPGNALGQAGGAAALGALLTPVAAILAFVDRGLAKDANCTALIDQAAQGKQLPTANNRIP